VVIAISRAGAARRRLCRRCAASEARFAYRPEQSVTLASTTKLITTPAALDTLGPKCRWRTRAYLDGQLHEGVLYGDLRIVGGGDARLSRSELVGWFKLIQWLRRRGLSDEDLHVDNGSEAESFSNVPEQRVKRRPI
jgi:serine-type D-Ala-D-Ala carboxypeptidase/endopeptidase (penicillin-binding protein 4)